MNVIIATIKEWNIKNYFELKERLSQHNFSLITNKEDLNINFIKQFSPHIIFFPHWSWKIPKEIFNNYKSILFHMTDLPFGKGGSPLQNLIINKIYKTKITALEVTENIDSGKIYLKKDVDISIGSAEELFIKISEIIFFDMIPYLIENNDLTPYAQEGNEVIFKRRNPSQSNMLNQKFNSLVDIYDFIRMLDAPSYPKAFIELNNDFIIKFTNIKRHTNKLSGDFIIIKKENYENINSSSSS